MARWSFLYSVQDGVAEGGPSGNPDDEACGENHGHSLLAGRVLHRFGPVDHGDGAQVPVGHSEHGHDQDELPGTPTVLSGQVTSNIFNLIEAIHDESKWHKQIQWNRSVIIFYIAFKTG